MLRTVPHRCSALPSPPFAVPLPAAAQPELHLKSSGEEPAAAAASAAPKLHPWLRVTDPDRFDHTASVDAEALSRFSAEGFLYSARACMSGTPAPELALDAAAMRCAAAGSCGSEAVHERAVLLAAAEGN